MSFEPGILNLCLSLFLTMLTFSSLFFELVLPGRSFCKFVSTSTRSCSSVAEPPEPVITFHANTSQVHFGSAAPN